MVGNIIMDKNTDNSDLDDYISWEFAHAYKKEELVSKLKKFILDIEKGHIRIDVNEVEDTNEGSLDIEFPSDEVLCTFEYDSEPMYIDKNVKKDYFGIKLFWSDLGVEKLIEEEAKLDELDEDDEIDLDEDIEDLEADDD
ncbi:MAG: hypothetical protein HeimC3_54480 [Candidatus Heimdallarchaeota archaeon LC_3]|nr:MAG: hypothetical protein HeimC3_54480 [Candidatus Heimdallarchaeota archaeon LC_3]